MEPVFKGGKFINRYKITKTLTTKSPLHIGSGEMMIDAKRLPKADEEKDEVPKFSTVVTDARGRAYIPGSTIKGNLRMWLTQLFSDFALAIPNIPARDLQLQAFAEDLAKQKKQKHELHSLLRMTEYLFGSVLNEGKLEFWDAPMKEPPKLPREGAERAYSAYDQTRGTILLKSVAIDPVTGTAAKNKLFNYEVVPEGAQFALTVAGQNLNPDELGMLLFALDGFNSFIYPVTLGGMGSIGFGRFASGGPTISRLDHENFNQWLNKALEKGHAGYENLTPIAEAEQADLIVKFQERFKPRVK